MIGQIGDSGADVRADTSCRRNESLDKPSEAVLPQKRGVNRLPNPSVIVNALETGYAPTIARAAVLDFSGGRVEYSELPGCQKSRRSMLAER